MKAEYKRDIHNSYMVFEEGAGEENAYEGKMLANNKISNFLKLEIRNIDNKQQFYYDITSKQPIVLVFQKGQLNREQICKIMGGILQAVESAGEFLLNENNFILEPEYVYINISNMQVNLCYLPGYNKDINIQVRGMIEYIMDKVDYQKEDGVLLAYGLYKISRSDNCTLSALKGVLEGKTQPYKEWQEDKLPIEETIEKHIQEEPDFLQKNSLEFKNALEENRPEEMRGKKYALHIWLFCGLVIVLALAAVIYAVKSQWLFDPFNGKINTFKAGIFLGVLGFFEFCTLNYLLGDKKNTKLEKAEEQPVDEQLVGNDLQKEEGENKPVFSWKCEEDNYQEDERTVVLGSRETNSQYQLSAVNRELYQDIPLIEFPFFVGKLKTKVDYSIPNQAISRFHAKFEKEADQFYLMDLNSTNGTFLNGQRLNANDKKEIFPGDQVGFADVIYILKKI